MNNFETENKKEFKEALFERIESEHICPRSRLFFFSKECSVWLVWLLSVLVGSLAVSVLLFVVSHQQYELYEATHENIVTFMVDVLPYVWISVFGIMTYVAIYNIRHTKRGYRYSLRFILLSSLLLSFVGGSVFQFFSLGFTVDHIMGTKIDSYMSQEKMSRRLWQMPNEGRLLGFGIIEDRSSSSVVAFEDVLGNEWSLDVSELNEHDTALLSSQKKVRLMGVCTDRAEKVFHVCGVFPWMVKSDVTVDDMVDERKLFVERVRHHARRGQNRVILDNQLSVNPVTESICAAIAPVRRMSTP